MTADDTLTPRQREIVAYLVAGYTQDETAERVEGRCSRSTVARVARNYRDVIAAERDARARRTADRLQGATAEALDCLLALLRSGNDSVRLGAARTILDGALRWADAIDLDERLREVERRAGLRAV